eukprot:CAMPEP_0116891694 /NCGR_PEP_ID=MMETSP0467-20121206/2040_1 /TAXON_ID=283647 /ORGANISM="Mesodinium pulex, Strain SPMC105" /LENGTH=131 /DNA_ID=CAMNT_0004560325 /DNA_START=31 /DNA_END=426 /DNA_ORIENTATION=+
MNKTEPNDSSFGHLKELSSRDTGCYQQVVDSSSSALNKDSKVISKFDNGSEMLTVPTDWEPDSRMLQLQYKFIQSRSQLVRKQLNDTKLPRMELEQQLKSLQPEDLKEISHLNLSNLAENISVYEFIQTRK